MAGAAYVFSGVIITSLQYHNNNVSCYSSKREFYPSLDLLPRGMLGFQVSSLVLMRLLLCRSELRLIIY